MSAKSAGAALLVCVAVAALAAATGGPEPMARVPTLLERLQSADRAEREAALLEIRAFCRQLQDAASEDEPATALPAYEALVSGLIQIVAEQRDNYVFRDRKLLAVMLLGDMRAASAVDVLLDNLTFHPPGLVSTELDRLAAYPCAGALVRIGEPSMDGILRRLDRKYSDVEITLLSQIVARVLQPKPGLARFGTELQDARQRVTNLESITAQLRRWVR